MTMGLLKTLCVCFVITRVPKICQKIQFTIRNQSISRSGITSFETWWRKRLCLQSLSTLTTKRQTYSLNLLMVRGLNLCIRQLVSVSFLELYLPCDLSAFIVACLLYKSHMFCWMMSCFFFTSFVLYLFLFILFYLLFFSVFKNSKNHKN